MGSYTYVQVGERPLLQCHFARDFNTYRRGDLVPWKAKFNAPGEHPDGIWEAFADTGDDKRPWFVVIKDQRIRVAAHDGETPEARAAVHAWLSREYEFAPPPRDWWPEVAWEAKAWRQAEFDKHCSGNPISDFTRAMMRRPGMLRMIFNPRKPRPDLLDVVREPVLAEFQPLRGWQYGDEMLCAAAEYRMERLCTEAGLWDEGPYREHPIFPQAAFHGDQLMLGVAQLIDEPTLTPAISGDGPVKVCD